MWAHEKDVEHEIAAKNVWVPVTKEYTGEGEDFVYWIDRFDGNLIKSLTLYQVPIFNYSMILYMNMCHRSVCHVSKYWKRLRPHAMLQSVTSRCSIFNNKILKLKQMIYNTILCLEYECTVEYKFCIDLYKRVPYNNPFANLYLCKLHIIYAVVLQWRVTVVNVK